MANTISLYDKRSMIRALDQMKSPNSFLATTFFNLAGGLAFDTESVDIDKIDRKRRPAEFQSSRLAGKLVEREGFVTVTRTPATIKPKMVIDPENAGKRMMGEAAIYGGNNTAGAYARKQLGLDLKTMRDMITRKIEMMAAESLLTGALSVSGDGLETSIINWDMKATHKITLTGTDLWTDSDSNPLTLIRTWKRLIAKDSGLNASVMVHGSSAWDGFINNAKVQTLLDNRRISIGGISPRPTAKGVTYQATIEGVEHYSYDEWYWNGSSDVPLVTANKVIFGATDAYTNTLFGAIKDLDVFNKTKYFSKSWIQEDPSVRYAIVQSAPLTAMHQPDGFINAIVVA